MKERPILFSGPMVRAILAGDKTQTRRVIKPQPVYLTDFWTPMWGWKEDTIMGGYDVSWCADAAPEAIVEFCPYGKPGDQLWVRETWAALYPGKDDVFTSINPWPSICSLAYKATEERGINGSWRPSIHMPRRVSRITLGIVSVRAQRLQDITSEDAQAEGIEVDICDNAIVTRDYSRKEKWFQMWSDDLPNYVDIEQIAQASFRSLWDHINGKREGCAWQDNPWVWAVEFRVVKP